MRIFDWHKFRNRLSRYSLRSFLVFFTLVAVWFGWVAFVGSHQKSVIRITEEQGGYVRFQWQGNNNDPQPPIRTWMASKLGEEFVFSIVGVSLEGEKVGDDTALHLAPHLEKLRYLNWLEFRGTKVTNEDLLRILGVQNTNITDAGISVLESWRDLRQLRISENDGVTAAAVVRLQKALPRCKVD